MAKLHTKKPKQLTLLKSDKTAYGGDLRNTRKGRQGARPLATRETMHLVLRSTKAKGDWSFRKPKNDAAISRIIMKFSSVYGVRVISMANVGNHLHMQIQLGNRFTFKPFIRAVTGAIAMAVTGRNRWTQAARTSSSGNSVVRNPVIRSTVARNPGNRNAVAGGTEKFWDARPYTRVVRSLKAFLNLKDYVRLNQLEGHGYRRDDARFMLKVEKKAMAEWDW